MPEDPVAALLSQPIKLQRTTAPVLSDTVIERRNNPVTYTPSQKLPYMTYDKLMAGSNDVYDPLDFPVVGQRIRDNVVKAIESRFPVVGKAYTLKVENVHYEKPKQTELREEKDVLLHEGTLQDRLKGDWVLYDNKSGKEIQRKKTTLLNVPRMTDRGTFIRNGAELGLKHMFRLRSGVYTHIKNNGQVSAHINPEQTTGQQMAIDLDQATGIFSVSRGTRTYGLLPLMKAAGVPDEAVKKVLGEELYNVNYDKYKKMMDANSPVQEEYRTLWNESIAPIKLDPETTASTLGKAFDKMDPDVFLRASGRVLQVSKTMSDLDTDDRDSLRYQRIMGPADYIPERIVRDGGGLLRKLFNTVIKNGNLDAVNTGAFQPQVDSVFMDDKHAGYIDGSSPLESMDFAAMVSRIGEGGIGSLRAAPAETRAVNDSYINYIDSIRSPECCSADTEVLTKDGWRKISDIKFRDVVGGVLDGVQIRTDVLQMNEYDYDGELIGYDDGAVSFLVTPDHRLIFAEDEWNFKPKVVYAKDWNIEEDNKVYVPQGTQKDGSQLMGVWTLDKSKYFKQSYKGKVYCPTVLGGMIIVKRNNAKAGVLTGNSLKVGLDVYMTHGVMKDSAGNLYNKFKDKSGKVVVVPMNVAAASVVATPEFYDPKGDPDEFIPAMYQGKGIEYVKRKDVDFFVDNSNNMLSLGAGMIPLIGGIRSNRTLMGCLAPETSVVVVQLFYLDSGITEVNTYNIPAREILENGYQKKDDIYLVSLDLGTPCFRKLRGVHKVTENLQLYEVSIGGGISCKVNGIHKWKCKVLETSSKDTVSYLTTEEIKKLMDEGKRITIPYIDTQGYKFLGNVLTATYGSGLVTDKVIKSIEPAGEAEYLVDIDVNDNVYLLSNGMFTHNSKYGNQAVPLTHGESPLVQRKLTLNDGEETTTERFIGRQLGARFAPMDGVITSMDNDSITMRGRDGQLHHIDLYNDYPANQKGYISSRPLVKPGDRVHANQILAATNYTDDEGTAALGTNLRVAFLTGRNAGTFEDSIQISETAAKTKLASTQLYKLRGETTDDIEYSKSRYLSLFKDDFTPEQLDKIDDNGLPKVGAVFEEGDPVYLGVQKREIGVHGLAKNAAVPYVTRWEHEDPGTVTNVIQGKKHLTVYTKCVTPMKVGDKLCFDSETEVLTDKGWKLFKDLNDTERVMTLELATGETYLTTYSERFSYDYKGKMYSLKNEFLDICVTPDHRNIVTANTNTDYVRIMTSKEVFGKTVFHITGQNVLNPHNFKPSKTKQTKEEWIDYDGKVYCLTVPYTHTMFVRRHGKTWWSGNSSRFGSKGVLGCYDSTTYVFTKDEGFKLFSDLKETDEVATLDPVTNTAHFEVPKAIQVYDYEGEMYGYDDRYLNWLVTPNHNMWATSKDNNHKRHPEDALFHRVSIQKVHGKGWKHTISADFPDVENPVEYVTIPSCENAPHAKNINTTFRVEDFARFLGIWLAEGHVLGSSANNIKHYVIITQKADPADPASIDRCTKISSLLDRMGFYWSRQGIKYCISHKALFNYLKQFGHSADKYIPEEVFTSWPRTAKEALFEYMYMGDGDKVRTNDLRYSTCSPMLRDGVVRLCTLLGYRANWTKMRDRGLDSKGRARDALYRVSITKSRVAISKKHKDRIIRKGYYKEQYSGKVYCCTVSTGVILVQRNGKCMWCGNSIIPDDQMPRDANGVPFDVLQSPLGLPSRLNTSMLAELQLAKIAQKTGKPYSLPDFMPESIVDFTDNEMKKYGVEPDEDVYDPVTGKTIPNVQTGVLFYYKLKHMAEIKERSRSTGQYSSEDVPLKGPGAARRFGTMETSAVYSGGGMEVLRDAKIVRGQRNDEFWRDYRSGKYPETPGFPLVHQKFFAHLKAAGINIEDRGDRIHIYGQTNSDLRKLTGDRQVTKAATYDSKKMQPVSGGLFDPTIFGVNGDQWGYVELPEPVLNPMMFKPIASILGWKDKELSEYLSGERKLDGKFGSQNLIDTLKKIDLPKELAKAKQVLKSQSTTLEQRDMARKRLRAIEPMLREGKTPEDFFVTRMPILPPRFRPVTEMSNGVGIAADINFLYKRAMDAIDDLVLAKKELPEELQLDARRELYNSINAVTGLQPTDDPKLEAKGVAGALRWAFGKGSPKLGSCHRKVFGANLDLGSLNVITPDNSLTIDQVGVPEPTAWKMFEPFVVRKLVQGGSNVINAMKSVLDQTPEARRALVEVMKNRPILINRAPTLWRYGIQGQYPVLVKGNALRINPNICKLMNADYDGDTCVDFVSLFFSPENFKKLLDFSGKRAILSNGDTQTMEDSMIRKEAEMSLVGIRCAISDVPVVEGSERVISDRITEWDVLDGVLTEAIDRSTGEKMLAPVTKLSLHKDVDMYDVTLSTYGAYKHVITVSKEGTLLSYKDGKIVITDASEAKGAVVPRARIVGDTADTSFVADYIDIGKKYYMSYDLGLFLGMMIGDGWVDANFTVHLAAENKQIQDEFQRITSPDGGCISVRKPSELFAHDTQRFGTDTAHRFTVYMEKGAPQILRKLIGSGAYNKKIPMLCFAARRAHRLGVLAGLIATDGCVSYSDKPANGKKSSQKGIFFHTTSQMLRDGIIELCRTLGVRASATAYMGPNSKVPCYSVNLSVRDMAKLAKEVPSFKMITEHDQKAFSQICASVDLDEIDPFDPVPFPAHLKRLFSQALYDTLPASEVGRYSKVGYISRNKARQFIPALREFDYSIYSEVSKYRPDVPVPGYTPSQVKQLAEDWIRLVENEDVQWEVVTDVKYIGKMDGWDLTAPGPLTFTLGSGTFVQDTMTTHVPVSNEAIKAIDEHMLPSRNLLSPIDNKAHFIPRSEFAQGLYLASRTRNESPIRFKSKEDMMAALKRGEIKVDTPVIIG